MNKQREDICRKCRMLPSIHHLEYPCCGQPFRPLDDDEWQQLGVSPQDRITVESVRKMMEISLQPYCMERMLAAHPIEWWYKMIK